MIRGGHIDVAMLGVRLFPNPSQFVSLENSPATAAPPINRL